MNENNTIRARILAHRGWWLEVDEKNSPVALGRALKAGFGIETDIRDQGGTLVISHDPPRGSCLGFDAFLDMYVETESEGWLALNVKADGLADDIGAALNVRGIKRYFLFDMSVPDMRGYAAYGLRFFTRRSDVETEPSLYEQAAGLWLDAFDISHFPADQAAVDYAAGKMIAFVSPELHGRPFETAWKEWLDTFDLADCSGIFVCTDLPDRFLDNFK